MRILAHGGSAREDPPASYDNIPPRGYGDGYGGYGTYGASPHGKGWHAEYGDMGYGPLLRHPSWAMYPQMYPGAYGAKGYGKGKEGNHYILQAPKGKGSDIIYPLRQKGGGKFQGG